ncbi:MAG TPA: thioesterase family protein [Bryobacterales bacterium]|nr:thioesterase family protein [Bryobacterales bacterium]
MLEPGVSLEKTWVVTDAVSIRFLGNAVKPSLATPSMIMWLEFTARDAVLPLLDPGQDTVGTHVSVSHLAATPIGMKVISRATLVKIDRRRLTFSVEAFDEKEKIGEGTHERFLIDVARYAERLKEKLG